MAKKYDVAILSPKKSDSDEPGYHKQLHLRLDKLSAYRVMKNNLETAELMIITRSQPAEQVIINQLRNQPEEIRMLIMQQEDILHRLFLRVPSLPNTSQ